MKKSFGLIAVLTLALLSPAIHAQQASAPAGSTGQCKDDSYTSQAAKRGACRGHKGVKEWYAAAPAPAAAAAASTATPPTATAITAAAVPTSAPAGSTGQCKDDSYTSQASKRGACRGHKGVKEWYAVAPAAAAAPIGTPPAAPVGKSKSQAPATAAPGGAPGLVWVNDASKTYHCPNDKWYGKTKHGEYLGETEAKAKGFHAEHGKACTP